MSFLPAYEIVAQGGTHRPADPAARRRSIWVLHGIFGSRRNWWSFARRFVAAAPDWHFVLVDLREHGASRGAPGPHNLDACAADLAALARELGDGPQALIGHSFGGKVAMRTAERLRPGLDMVWLMDCALGPGPSAAVRASAGPGLMLRVLRELPESFASRGAVGTLLQQRGIPEHVARWMATSLQRAGDAWRWSFDFDSAQALLDSYWDFDGWPLLEAAGTGIRWHTVTGGQSPAHSPEDRARLKLLHERKLLVSHELADAGHWVQSDAPEELLALMLPHFPALGA